MALLHNKKQDLRICRVIFHPTASWSLSGWLIINNLQKYELSLGTLESTQTQM